MGAGALRDGGDPDSRLRRADADDDARQAVGPPRGRVRRGARPAAREPRLAGGGGRRGAPGAVPALRQAPLGRDGQGDRPQLARREPRGPRGRGGPRRRDLRPARPGRGVPRGAGVHRHPRGEHTPPGLAHAAEGARGLDAHRRARPAPAPAAAGGLAPRHAGRARRGARGGAGGARPARVRGARVPGLRPGRLPSRRRRPALFPRDEPAPDVRAGRVLRHHRRAARAAARRAPGGDPGGWARAARSRAAAADAPAARPV